MYVMVDVEADGPIPSEYSMIAVGAVVVEPALDRTFLGYLRPMTSQWIPDALKVSGFSRDEVLKFPQPSITMGHFHTWVKEIDRPVFIADNNGFDWQFVNWYFHKFLGVNPFGFSSQNLNSLYKGLTRNVRASFKHLRKTKHDHNPVNDAMGNAEALLEMRNLGLNF